MRKNAILLMMAVIMAIFSVKTANAQDFAFAPNNQTGRVKAAADAAAGPGNSLFNQGVTGDTSSGGGTLNFLANVDANGNVLQPNGSATFSAIDAAVGDFNLDGRRDIAVVSVQDSVLGVIRGRLTTFLGTGDGTFALPISVSTPTTKPVSIVSGDFDLDGDFDVAVANQADGAMGSVDSISIYNGGVGGFGAPITIPTAVGPTNVISVAAGRLNGDAFTDFAFTFAGGNTVQTIQTNNAPVISAVANPAQDAGITLAGTVTAGNQFILAITGSVTPLLTPAAVAPRVITIGQGNLLDQTGLDADLDLIVATSVGAEIAENQPAMMGPSTFILAAASPVSAGTAPVGVIADDVNGDNLTDLLILNAGSGTVTTRTATASNLGGYDVPRTSVVGANPIALSTLEFNGDGRRDIVVSSASSGVGTGQLQVLTGSGTGVFTLAATFSPAASGDGIQLPVGVAVGRIDIRSTTDDIVLADFAGGGPGGAFFFSAAGGYQTLRVPAFTATSLTLALDDPNNFNDVVMVEQNRAVVFVLLNPGTTTFRLGTINIFDIFTQAQIIPTSATAFRGANNLFNLAFTDVGTPTANNAAGQLVVGLNNGMGNFSDVLQFRQFVATPGATNVQNGDFNNDGIEDLAYIDYGSNFAAVALNDTTDFFLAPRFRETGGFQPVSMAVGDYNDDDNLDLAVLNQGAVNVANQAIVSIMLGRGDGQVVPTGALLQVPNIGLSIVGGLQELDLRGLGRAASLNQGRQVDFNNDGFPDLAVASTAGGSTLQGAATPTVSLLLNRPDSPGSFNVQPPIELIDDSTGPNAVALQLTSPLVVSGRPGTNQATLRQGGANYAMSVGDYNADGSPDLVVTGALGAAPATQRANIYLFGNNTAGTMRVSRPLRTFIAGSAQLSAGDFFVSVATGEFIGLPNLVPETLHLSVNGNVWIDQNQTSILNHAPILSILRSDLNAPRPGGGRKAIITAGQALSIPVTANDIDASPSTGGRDLVRFSLASTPQGEQPPAFATLRDNGNNTATFMIPAGANINPGPGVLRARIAIEGTDQSNAGPGGRTPLTGRTYFTLIVNPNRPPQVGAINNVTLEAGRTQTIQLSINDPDGNRVTSAVRCDRGSFASITGNTLSLAPQAGDTGTTSCTVTATDEFGLAGSQSFAVTVGAANVAPRFVSNFQDVSIRSGAAPVSVPVSATDDNGTNGLRLTLVSAPAFVSIADNGNGTGTIRVAPALTDTQGGRVTVQVTDPAGLSAQASFNVTVTRNVQIAGASFAKQSSGSNLFINGSGFGSSGATVTVNGTNVSARISGQSDTSITLKGSRRRLSLRSGPNQIVVTSGGVTSNTFVLNLLNDEE